jgi:hypothetical protein
VLKKRMAAISQQLKRELPAVMDASAAAAAPPATTTTPFAIVSTADAARDPLAAVAALHSARVSSLVLSSSSSPSAVAEDGDWGVTELFRAVAEDESLAKTVSSIEREYDRLIDGTLENREIRISRFSS